MSEAPRRPHGHDQNPYRDLGQGNQEVDDARSVQNGRRDDADSDDESTREELRYNEDQEDRGR
jgi:hypothetical protein